MHSHSNNQPPVLQKKKKKSCTNSASKEINDQSLNHILAANFDIKFKTLTIMCGII